MEYTTLLLDMDGTFLDFGAAERSAFFRAMEITVMRPTKTPISFIPGLIMVCGKLLNGEK